MNIEFKTISGTLFFNDLEESNLTDLERETIRGFPTTTKRQHSTDTVQASTMEITPFTKTGELLVKSVMKNNDGGKTYDAAIMFNDVNFEDSDTPSNITFKATDGDDYHMTKLHARGNEVKVKCDCMDFYYRFAIHNFSDGSLYGKKPPPYRRKTDTRPPANPNNVPGLCKHLMKLAQALHQSNMLVD